MKNALRVFVPVLFCALAFGASAPSAFATSSIVAVTTVSSGTTISADTAANVGGISTSLTDLSMAEASSGNIKSGTIMLNAPAGFVFDLSHAVTVEVLSNGSNNNYNINHLATSTPTPVVMSSDGSSITFTVTSKSTSAKNTLVWQNIHINPSVGTPLGNGSVTITGASITSGTSFDNTTPYTLTETVGALATIMISPSTASLTVGGSTQTLSATTQDQFGNSVSASLTWASDNTAVATVDSSGVVTPVAAGTANITASSGGVTSKPSVVTVASGSGGDTSYTLTYTAGSHGSISGNSSQTVNHGANGTEVIAIPATGYSFTGWSDGVLAASRTEENVTGNSAVSASFADVSSPVIALNGSATIHIVIGNTFTDPGATVADTVDGSGDVIHVGGDIVNTAVDGTYHVTYDAADAAHNAATQVIRSVVIDTVSVPLVPTTHDDGTVTAIVPEATVASVTGDVSVRASIPAGITITSSTGWDGTLTLPKAVTTTVAPTADSGNTAAPVGSIEVGFADTHLTFDRAVRLAFSGQAGKFVGWSQGGTFHAITTLCAVDSQTMGDALPDDSECKIDVEGTDLVVWTKHFSTFTTYTQSAIPAPVSSGSSGGSISIVGGGSGTPNPLPGATVGTGFITTTSGQGQVLGAAAYFFANNLRRGMFDAEVAELQKLLVAKGYAIPDAVTTYFGPQTFAALRAFQSDNDIFDTGFCGPLTREVLNKITAA